MTTAKPSENTSSNNPENTSMTESSSPKSTSIKKATTTRTRKTMTATTKKTTATTATKAPAKPRTRKPAAAKKPVVAPKVSAPLASSAAQGHLNEAKNHLRAAMLILMSHLAIRVGRDMEIASAWLKPHWDRFLLSLQTAWNVVPAPMRSLAAEMFPHIVAAIRHLVIALAIIAKEQARAAITAATPHAKKAEAEALVWLGSAIEGAEIELRTAMTQLFVKRSNA